MTMLLAVGRAGVCGDNDPRISLQCALGSPPSALREAAGIAMYPAGIFPCDTLHYVTPKLLLSATPAHDPQSTALINTPPISRLQPVITHSQQGINLLLSSTLCVASFSTPISSFSDAKTARCPG
ncbi:hypothetical protein FQN50_001212 [Emmonsiellopsis sp. PD_5]|nr:hypothetical protein FQN50_001212 [Emmonsiellopsis sp. PD_5]